MSLSLFGRASNVRIRRCGEDEDVPTAKISRRSTVARLADSTTQIAEVRQFIGDPRFKNLKVCAKSNHLAAMQRYQGALRCNEIRAQIAPAHRAQCVNGAAVPATVADEHVTVLVSNLIAPAPDPLPGQLLLIDFKRMAGVFWSVAQAWDCATQLKSERALNELLCPSTDDGKKQ